MNLLLKQMKNTIQLEMLNWWSIYTPSGSGVADKQMSDDTFNEQEWEALETTAIDHAVAQFEIPPIVNPGGGAIGLNCRGSRGWEIIGTCRSSSGVTGVGSTGSGGRGGGVGGRIP